MIFSDLWSNGTKQFSETLIIKSSQFFSGVFIRNFWLEFNESSLVASFQREVDFTLSLVFNDLTYNYGTYTISEMFNVQFFIE